MTEGSIEAAIREIARAVATSMGKASVIICTQTGQTGLPIEMPVSALLSVIADLIDHKVQEPEDRAIYWHALSTRCLEQAAESLGEDADPAKTDEATATKQLIKYRPKTIH